MCPRALVVNRNDFVLWHHPYHPGQIWLGPIDCDPAEAVDDCCASVLARRARDGPGNAARTTLTRNPQINARLRGEMKERAPG